MKTETTTKPATHSPLPWRFTKDNAVRTPEPTNLILSEATGACVAVTKLAFGHSGNIHTRHSEMEANAAFIVRAVNSHAELVAALEAYLAKFELDPWSKPERDQARAALAKAKGGAL